MHPIFMIAIPLLLIAVAMTFIGIVLPIGQLSTLPKQVLGESAAFQREAHRRFFDRPRSEGV